VKRETPPSGTRTDHHRKRESKIPIEKEPRFISPRTRYFNPVKRHS
jgi:hypothetical protein